MSRAVRFRMLGSLGVSVDGTPVSIGAPRQRALLALLLLDANRSLPGHTLIEGIWGAAALQHPDAALQIVVSRLRNALGSGCRPRDVGAGRIPHRRRRGRARSAAGAARVPPRAGIVGAGRLRRRGDGGRRRALVLDRRRARRSARRTLLRRRESSARPSCGSRSTSSAPARTSGAVVTSRCSATSTRGFAWSRGANGSAPITWSRCIAPVVASTRSRSTKTSAVASREDLGVDPSTFMQELHARVVRQDPTLLARRAGIVAALPAWTPCSLPFVGRAREETVIFERLRDVAAGSTHMVLVEGVAGIGKSRLALEAARRAGGDAIVLAIDGGDSLRPGLHVLAAALADASSQLSRRGAPVVSRALARRPRRRRSRAAPATARSPARRSTPTRRPERRASGPRSCRGSADSRSARRCCCSSTTSTGPARRLLLLVGRCARRRRTQTRARRRHRSIRRRGTVVAARSTPVEPRTPRPGRPDRAGRARAGVRRASARRAGAARRGERRGGTRARSRAGTRICWARCCANPISASSTPSADEVSSRIRQFVLRRVAALGGPGASLLGIAASVDGEFDVALLTEISGGTVQSTEMLIDQAIDAGSVARDRARNVRLRPRSGPAGDRGVARGRRPRPGTRRDRDRARTPRPRRRRGSPRSGVGRPAPIANHKAMLWADRAGEAALARSRPARRRGMVRVRRRTSRRRAHPRAPPDPARRRASARPVRRRVRKRSAKRSRSRAGSTIRTSSWRRRRCRRRSGTRCRRFRPTERVSILTDGSRQARDAGTRAQLTARLATELVFTPSWGRARTLADAALAEARAHGDATVLTEVLLRHFAVTFTPHNLAERRQNARRRHRRGRARSARPVPCALGRGRGRDRSGGARRGRRVHPRRVHARSRVRAADPRVQHRVHPRVACRPGRRSRGGRTAGVRRDRARDPPGRRRGRRSARRSRSARCDGSRIVSVSCSRSCARIRRRDDPGSAILLARALADFDEFEPEAIDVLAGRGAERLRRSAARDAVVRRARRRRGDRVPARVRRCRPRRARTARALRRPGGVQRGVGGGADRVRRRARGGGGGGCRTPTRSLRRRSPCAIDCGRPCCAPAPRPRGTGSWSPAASSRGRRRRGPDRCDMGHGAAADSSAAAPGLSRCSV